MDAMAATRFPIGVRHHTFFVQGQDTTARKSYSDLLWQRRKVSEISTIRVWRAFNVGKQAESICQIKFLTLGGTHIFQTNFQFMITEFENIALGFIKALYTLFTVHSPLLSSTHIQTSSQVCPLKERDRIGFWSCSGNIYLIRSISQLPSGVIINEFTVAWSSNAGQFVSIKGLSRSDSQGSFQILTWSPHPILHCTLFRIRVWVDMIYATLSWGWIQFLHLKNFLR